MKKIIIIITIIIIIKVVRLDYDVKVVLQHHHHHHPPHVLVQAQYTNGETRWTGKGCLECQNHEVSDTKHPFFVIYIWTDHCNPFNWSPTHSTGPQSIQLVPKFQYWLIQCQNGQFWQNKLILSFHCASPQPSQVVQGSFNWSSPHSTGPQTSVVDYTISKSTKWITWLERPINIYLSSNLLNT